MSLYQGIGGVMEDKYDVVVGIPSYNEYKNIGHVTRIVGEGLSLYFKDARSIIVNCDNNSPDDTNKAFLSTDTAIPKRYISTKAGVNGKGNNLWNLFRFCRDAEANIAIVVDADLRSITPEWVQYLGHPIRDGYDFVSPNYSMQQFDGNVTNHLCYPLTFALTGLDIRQPTGGEFAFSPKLYSFWLKRPWTDAVRQYGIDIFLSLSALYGEFNICQAGLGAKVHTASIPKFGRMFEDVVYVLFSTVLENRSKWCVSFMDKGSETLWQTDEARKVELYGLKKLEEPESLEIDILKLKQDCQQEYAKYQDLVKKYLRPYAYQRIHNMFLMDYYDVDIMLWSQIVYTLVYLFDGAAEESKKEIINALKPLCFCRSLSFDYQTWRFSVGFAEEEIRHQALAFLCQKPYLLGLYLKNAS
jgi:glycosyltransferase involved in cell wall biosynthesis